MADEEKTEVLLLTEEQKAAAVETAKKQQREAIKVTVMKPTTEETKEEEKEEEKTEEVEKTEEKIEASEKTQDELEQEKLEAKTAKEKERIQKRIDKEVAKRKALEEENAELKRKLAEKPDSDKILTEDDVNKRSEILAEQKRLRKEFDQACDKIFKEGVKTDKDFPYKVNAMAEDIGQIPAIMIGVLDDLDNGGEVLSYLTNNVDEAEEIYTLSPAKMAVKLARISEKIITDKKPKPKPVSKAPDPAETVGGNNKGLGDIVITGKESTQEFIRKRNAQELRKRQLKMQGLA